MASEYNDLNNALNTFTATLNGIAERNQRNKYNQQVLDMSKDMQEWSKYFNERQFAESQRQWQDSFNFNVGAADLAQTNFENATRIRADDMSKAGLNPLNLVGGAEGTSANFMSGSSPAGSASANVPSPLAPFSVADLISRFAQMHHESAENAKNRRSAERIASIQGHTAENVANINSLASQYGATASAAASRYGADVSAASSRYGTDITSKTAAEYLAFQKMKAAEEIGLAYAKYDSDEVQRKFEREMAERGMTRQEARDVMDFVMHDKDVQLKIKALNQAKDIADADRKMQYITRFGTELMNDITRLLTETGIAALGKGAAKKGFDFFKNYWKNRHYQKEYDEHSEGLDGFDWFDM